MDIPIAIYHIALHIDANGNGITTDDLKEHADWETFQEASPEQIDGIVFYNEKSSRKYPAAWYVRRNPRWQDTWLNRFGDDYPDIASKLRADLLPVRKHDDISPSGVFYNMKTADLLRHTAYALLQHKRWIWLSTQERVVSRDNPADFYDLSSNGWGSITRQYLAEIKYRREWYEKASTIKSLDKHQTKLMKDYEGVLMCTDMHNGSLYMFDEDKLINAYYTEEFQDAFKWQPVMDATVRDVKPLPLGEDMPVMHQTTGDLIQTFFNFVLGAMGHEDEFAYEDALLLIKAAGRDIVDVEHRLDVYKINEVLEGTRKRLARLYGQHGSVDVEVSDENS